MIVIVAVIAFMFLREYAKRYRKRAIENGTPLEKALENKRRTAARLAAQRRHR